MSDPDLTGFVAGFAGRRDAAGAALRQAYAAKGMAFAPRDITPAPPPRHFDPAETGANPTEGWDPFDANQPATSFVDPVQTARQQGYDEGLAAALANGGRLGERDQALLDGLLKAIADDHRIDRERLAAHLRSTVMLLVTKMIGETGIDADLRAAIYGESTKARTISEVFEAWADTRPLEQAKLVDEWRKAVSRFVALWGDVEVAAITDEMVEGYRDALQALPSRARKDIAALPILDQIRIAREERLACLSGPTVAKSVSGLRVVLKFAKEKLKMIRTNPATLVPVANSKSKTNARLPFNEAELATIFSSPMMTDPNERSNDEFWCTFLAPLTGLRPEEMATCRPRNVKCGRGIAYISVELDPKDVRDEITARGEANKTGKTESSFRDVPIHWLLIEAGFLDFVERLCGIQPRPDGTLWFTGLTPAQIEHRDARHETAYGRIVDGVDFELVNTATEATGYRNGELLFRAPRGVRITLTCEGKGCPLREVAQATSLFHIPQFERELRAGIKLTIKIAKPNYIAKVTTIRIGAL